MNPNRAERRRSEIDARRRPDPLSIVKGSETKVNLHYGPLPPPDILKGYDDVLPGLAETITTQFIRESEHRRSEEKLDSEAMRLELKAARSAFTRAQWFVLTLGVLTLTIAGILAYKGAYGWASGFGLPSLVAVATALLTSVRKGKGS